MREDTEAIKYRGTEACGEEGKNGGEDHNNGRFGCAHQAVCLLLEPSTGLDIRKVGGRLDALPLHAHQYRCSSVFEYLAASQTEAPTFTSWQTFLRGAQRTTQQKVRLHARGDGIPTSV